ncbi:hypothetical protein [Methylobacterium sp. Leaf93]|uniref:hypothetical protein n=1 Tax=Methylobacterium sp. Leaf93 TaxID=1736249 RepID=UPI0012E793D6|nr:hypothetical protein [Methylobacterium sp. Leaf93]
MAVNEEGRTYNAEQGDRLHRNAPDRLFVIDRKTTIIENAFRAFIAVSSQPGNEPIRLRDRDTRSRQAKKFIHRQHMHEHSLDKETFDPSFYRYTFKNKISTDRMSTKLGDPPYQYSTDT